MKDYFIPIIFCSMFLNFGCRSEITRTDLPGLYAVKYPYGIEQLNIKADGTYEQLFAKNGESLKIINKGKWEVIRGDSWDANLLVLNEPVLIDDAFGSLSKLEQRSGVWQLRIRKSFHGEIYFPINDDQGFVFKKVR